MAMSPDEMSTILRDAFLELCDEEYRPHETAGLIPVSMPFEMYMDELMTRRKQRMRPRWGSRTVMMWILTIFLLLFSVFVAVSGLGEQIAANTSSREWQPGIYLDAPANLADQIEYWYTFTALPEGMTQIKGVMEQKRLERIWSNESGDFQIGFMQDCSYGSSWQGSNTYNYIERTVVGEWPAILYGLDNGNSDDRWLIEWNTDEYKLRMWVDFPYENRIDKEQLIEWAESMQGYDISEPEPDTSSDWAEWY